MLGTDELLELEERLKDELDDNLTEVLCKLNRMDQLNDLLDLLGMENLLEFESEYKPFNDRIIVVIGASTIKEKDIIGIANQLGIDKKRIEMHLDYEEAGKFNFEKMQYNLQYSAIMVGPMPHSGSVKKSYGSMIAAIEQSDGYPPVIRLGKTGLKITKSGFRNSLQKMIDDRIVV